jgi:hypothetical protein
MRRLTLVLALLTMSATAAAQLPVPLYRQCGESWSGDRLGTCSSTMCDAGCAVTSKAMIFAYYGGSRDPGQLNGCLRDSGGYADGCLVYWNDTCAPAGVHYAGSGGLDAELAAGYPVLTQVRSSRTSMHFVVITGSAGGGNYYINDPGWSYNTTAEAGYTLVRFHNYHGSAGPPPHPVIDMSRELLSVEGQERDFCESDGIFDLDLGQATTFRVTVTNVGDAVAQNLIVAFRLDDDCLGVTNWEILDNWRDNACGGDWCLNDSNDHPDNPPHDGPGCAFELRLNALSSGESKRVELTIEGLATTLDGDPAFVRAWVRHIDNFYEKSDWDAGFNNVGDYQTYNGGDLRAASELDVMGLEVCNDLDDDCDGEIDEDVCEAPVPDAGPIEDAGPDADADADADADDGGDAWTPPDPDDGDPPIHDPSDPFAYSMRGGCSSAGVSATNLGRWIRILPSPTRPL